MLEKIGKGVFLKIKSQLTESQKDEIEFLWKHFQEGKAISNLNENDAIKMFWLRLLKDVGCKDLQEKVKHCRDQEKVV